jgi:hypothetical protein
MGYNRRSSGGYLSTPGGHPSLSDDGSGDVVLKTGKKIIVPVSVTPQVVVDGAPTTGWRWTSGFMYYYAAGVNKTFQGAAYTQTPTNYETRAYGGLRVGGVMRTETTGDQELTGVGSVIVVNAPRLRVTSTGVYVLTTAIAAGIDGQETRIENFGANDFTLQEGVLIAAGSVVDMMYSSKAVAWLGL